MTNRFAVQHPALRWAAVALAPLSWEIGTSTRVRAGEEVPVASDYVLRTWDLEDGMTDHHVSSITRGGDGYLWFTTFSGLVRFDGVRFQLMSKRELPGLPSQWVSPVFAASGGSLWLGLDQGGVARWDPGGPALSVLPVQPRPTDAFWSTSFAEDAAGAVWFGSGSEARVFRSKDEVVSSFTTSDGVPPGGRVFVCSASDGSIWCATNEGVVRFDGKTFIATDVAGSGETRITRRRAGGIWVIRGTELRSCSDDGGTSHVADFKKSVDGTWINQIIEDREGNLWISTSSSGLFRFRGGNLAKVATSLGNISALVEDNEGTIWAGTWGGGLNRLTRRHFFMHPTAPDVTEVGAESVCLAADGAIWMVNRRGLPFVKADGRDRLFKHPAGWPAGERANVAHADPGGGVWIGTTTGLWQWHQGGFKRLPLQADVRAMVSDGDGGLCVATEAGELIFLNAYGKETGRKNLGAAEARSLARDSVGRIWCGTRDGRVFMGKNGGFTQLQLPDAELDWSVRFILPDHDQVWIGTLLGGLYRWRDGVVTQLPADSSLPLAEIRSLFIEPSSPDASASAVDTFWFGTAQGLFSTTRREVERRLRSEEPEIAVMRHGFNEGLPNLEFSQGGANGVARSPDGHLWFATNRGVLEVRPPTRPPQDSDRKVIIEGAWLDRKSERRDGTGGLVLPPRPGLLRIRYTLPELVSPGQVRFRYRLHDGGWNMAGADREATFVGLAPGRYRFEVAAAVGNRPWLPHTASLTFQVQPAWWQTLAFKLAVLLALVAAVWSGVTLRARAKIRRLQQQRAVERERTRIARDMHDDVGANLTHIATTSRIAMLDNPAATRDHLDEIAKTARETVDVLDEIVWAVNPRYDSLAGTVEYLGKLALRFLSTSGLQYQVDLPDEVPELPLAADSRHHLLLAVKEALNNAVKHSRGTKVRIHVMIGRGELLAAVEDDGVGLPPHDVRPGASGLRNLRERMTTLGGSVAFEAASPGGTRVVIRLPLQQRGSAGQDRDDVCK